MDVIYGLIPSMIIIGIVLVIILFWAIKNGQFDDFEGEAHRILMDEDPMPTNSSTKPIDNNNSEEKILDEKNHIKNKEKHDKLENRD